MNLPELSIRRHVLAYMMSGVIVLFGYVSYDRLGVDRFPYIEFPMISITTIMPGANPDIVDSSITNIVETEVNSVPGIEHIRSTSSPGVSNIIVTFDLKKDIDVAFNEVQAKVNQSLRLLPEDADPPVVAKLEVGASPIMWIAVRGDRTLQQLNQYARNILKKRLESIDGVGKVQLGGKRDRAIRVNINLNRMAALQVTTQDLIRAFKLEHVQFPGGFLVSDKTEKLMKLDLEFHNLAALREMIVAHREGSAIKLRDIATIEDGLEDKRQLARFNGKPSVGLGIVKIANANTVAIVEEVKKRLDTEIRPQLPPGITLAIASNDALFIEEMVLALKEHLLLGTLLTAIVVWLFLKSLRSTLIVAVAVPVSLLGAVAVMFFAGFTFNTLTLLALLLLIGVVVDDAIVILENIFRHREKIDPDPVSAALNGTNQVVFAVLASTFTLVSIFAPVIFMGGIIGMFFKSFSTVVTFGVLVSLFVSLTLTPMLCSRYLQVYKKHGKVYYLLDYAFHTVENFYKWLLGKALNFRWTVVFLTILVVLSSGYFFAKVGKGFVPEEDEGRFLVLLKTPLGSSIDYTDSRLKLIEELLESHKEIMSYFTAIGIGQSRQVTQGMAFVRLTSREERDIHQSDFLKIIRAELATIPGALAFAAPVPIISGLRGEPLQFVVRGTNLNEVSRISNEMLGKLSAIPGMGRIDLDLQLELPQSAIDINRTVTADLGLSSSDVAMAVNILAGGLNVAKYNDYPGDGERYDIRLKAERGELTSSADLNRIYLRTKDGEFIRLDTIARLDKQLGPAIIPKYDLQYAAQFFGSPTMPLGEALDNVNQTAAGLLPIGFTIKYMGQAEEFGKTVKYMSFTFLMAVVLVYMVLASQFNSFIQPLIIMIAQPLAIIGGIFGLWLVGHTLNIYSMIGLVLLIGLVAKNSILLVDFTNQLRKEGKDIESALKEACPIRMRPVLMTSLTIILALSPAALAVGAGSDTNGPLAVAVISGMISSTLLTLVVVPSVYSLVENAILRFKNRRTTSARNNKLGNSA